MGSKNHRPTLSVWVQCYPKTDPYFNCTFLCPYIRIYFDFGTFLNFLMIDYGRYIVFVRPKMLCFLYTFKKNVAYISLFITFGLANQKLL